MPERVQLRRTKGWRKPEGAIVVARPTKWGNPFKVGALIQTRGSMNPVPGVLHHQFPEGTFTRTNFWGNEYTFEVRRVRNAADAVALYAEWVSFYDDVFDPSDELAGHDLACWCPLDQPCHADVLLQLANPAESAAGSEATENAR